ncbi:hypothetical protein DL770_004818 [Monosporascus sp. CRB-9-2]|nr:hypothetical protein DL770_004818 [Monosporascus sp. CRB-9-2]
MPRTKPYVLGMGAIVRAPALKPEPEPCITTTASTGPGPWPLGRATCSLRPPPRGPRDGWARRRTGDGDQDRDYPGMVVDAILSECARRRGSGTGWGAERPAYREMAAQASRNRWSW